MCSGVRGGELHSQIGRQLLSCQSHSPSTLCMCLSVYLSACLSVCHRFVSLWRRPCIASGRLHPGTSIPAHMPAPGRGGGGGGGGERVCQGYTSVRLSYGLGEGWLVNSPPSVPHIKAIYQGLSDGGLGPDEGRIRARRRQD